MKLWLKIYKLEILKKLPDPVYFNIEEENSVFKETDLENIYELLDKAKEERISFVKEINTKREFKNPEYLQVRKI